MANRLEKFYEEAFGAPQSRGELYTGFFLLITGFVMTVVGLLLWMAVAPNFEGITQYNWRETGGVIAGLGAPAIFVGISVGLPTKWSMRVLDAIGVLLCLVGIGVFLFLYPHRWNTGTNDEVWGVLFYVVGCAALLASTISSLIGYYVARATMGAALARADESGVGDNYDIPDSVIEKDVELAMKRYGVSWGGTGADASKSLVQFDLKDEFAAGTVIGGKGAARSVTLDAPQVDSATDKLRTIRGGRGATMLDTKNVDTTTDALLKFRKQKFEMEQKKAKKRGGFWAAIKRLFGIKDKPTVTPAQTVAAKAPPSK